MEHGNILRAYEIIHAGTLQKELTNVRKDLDDGWQRVVFSVGETELFEGSIRDKLCELIEDQLGVSYLESIDLGGFQSQRISFRCARI